jgi:hypothetical protein
LGDGREQELHGQSAAGSSDRLQVAADGVGEPASNRQPETYAAWLAVTEALKGGEDLRP